MGSVIFVESFIATTLDELLSRTLEPKLHERWDLRFSRIDYLPKADALEPQRFQYATRIGLGLHIVGAGESVATRSMPEAAVSSLRFWSDDPKSLIRKGSGYWQYTATDDGVRFRTEYDYDCAWGWTGRLFDACFFRPSLAWATAWSFDRLRLWMEEGLDPRTSARAAIIDALARLFLAIIWCYQGLTPKLLWTHPQELELAASVIPSGVLSPRVAVAAVGIAEVLLGLLHVVAWGRRWPYWIGLGAMVAATIPALVACPDIARQPFNPVTLVAGMAGLAIAGLASVGDAPRASRCRFGVRRRS